MPNKHAAEERSPERGAAGQCLDRDVSGPLALLRVLGLLHLLGKNPEGLKQGQLIVALGSPKSSLLKLLRYLVAERYLVREHSFYRLGPRAFRMAANILSAWNFSKLVRPYLEELSVRSNECVYIGVLDRETQFMTCVDAMDSPQSLRYAIKVGTCSPLGSTAAGRVLLAYADTAFQQRYFTSVEGSSDHGVKDSEDLGKQLQDIRRSGLSICVGELNEAASAIGVPIHGSNGEVLAVIAIGAPTERFGSQQSTLREMILEIAGKISGEYSSAHVPNHAIARQAARRCGATAGWPQPSPPPPYLADD